MEGEMMCFVSGSNRKASVLYVNENTTLEQFRKDVSDKLQIPLSHFTLSYSMQQYGNSSVRIFTNDDLSRMVAIHHRANEHVIKMEATTATVSSSAEQSPNVGDKSISMKCSQVLDPVREEEILMDTVRMPLSWHESITRVGQTFENVKSLRMAISNFAIAKNFVYKFVKNDLQRLTVECDKKESMNCKWRLHASPFKHGLIWSIKTYNEVHACGGGITSAGNPYANRKWVASLLQSVLKHRPTYRTVEARKVIHEQYGIKMPYNTIWNGRELACQHLYGEGKRSYDMLRWYEKIVNETNPGSLVTIHKGADDRFLRMFICYQPCYDGFIDGCRPLLFLDGTFIKDRSKGILLAATAYDADNGLFPLAFCICNSEDTSNWCWFLSLLSRVLYEGPRTYKPKNDLAFISDLDKGLREAMRSCFPQAFHSFCVLHLAQNYSDNLKKNGFSMTDTLALGQMMKTAAYRCSFRDFERDMAALKWKSAMAYDILMTSYPPEKWANSLFIGVRYGHVTSNVAESYNNWIRDARQLPILAMVEQIRVRMVTRIHERREKAETWTSPLCPHTENVLETNNKKSLPFLVEATANHVYEVFDARTVTIDVSNRTCTCREWDVHRIPCKHACDVIRHLKQSVYGFCDDYLTVETFKKTYIHTLYPIPGYDMPCKSEEPIEIHPHATKRRRRRTKMRRINNRDLEVPPRIYVCSRCHQSGHNRQTCIAPIQDYICFDGITML